MNSRKTLLVSLLLLSAAATASAADAVDGVDSAKTVAEVKKSLPFAVKWKEGEFDGRKFLLALTHQGDGESYIDLHGWIYNEHFQEWRRILNIKTRNIGYAELVLDTEKGIVSVRGSANNDLKGVEILRFDLRATSNDAAYKNK